MDDPKITEDLIAAHGLKPDEYERILEIIGREPTFTELGIFSAMWNEHCSYKSSKKWLRGLPTKGPQVICGPGENAGVVDIGDGQAIVFKMESHNHPSYIEPYQGAATGVGGILRDVFTMGARPIAAMNSLSFGAADHPKTKQLVNGVVEGVGGYGNCFGVPTVGGEVRFHPAYNGNCLVNAFAAGLADADKIFYSAASGVGMPVVYLGAKTGRDGVGGATMASAEFDDTIEEKRPTVQVGDPFTEKRLMEACMELMRTGAVISIQDMGAAGLTCSAVEMGDKGHLGIKLELDRVPQREPNMTAYEMMLSESQERMLMVLNPELEAEARAVFEKWDLDFAIVGETIAEDRFVILHGNEVKADLPLSELSSSAPEYDRPWVPTPAAAPMADVPGVDAIDGLKALISSPNYAGKQWVYEQYDSQVMGDTVRKPGLGAGIVRIHGTDKAVAFTSDVTPRYVKANPVEGGKQAVAEAYRNLSAVGAKPLATTDNLNFGNPEKPEIMGQFVGALQGIGEACIALDTPIVSGNVSLYNETDGQGILPTPTICAVGLIDNLNDAILGTARDGHVLLLLGETAGHLGQSALLAEVYNREDGDAPHVDLAAEAAHGDFIRANRALINACTDLADGGLALAAFEMAEAAGVGVSLDASDTPTLFGEDQGRYLIACSFDKAEALMIAAGQAGVTLQTVGKFGGTDVSFGGSSAPLAELTEIFRSSFYTAIH
ncbi:MAG: phosphoribosylformylglycinamidine synthase subunit PurL [Marivivens sp.]|jgi:phosphoribosylformylglycinamidine synthase subunit PurL|uniref:phosphoribosylformylglycinamidine synthase subunit PurL n=1 Tax=Marivivens sp. TaxID=1978374 RepID=UPI0017E6187C|nr:phosphoribosylformylglycinamidine synthase subunit PurL [Marivivens sp.]MCL7406032.1 phosphoribosylformylglycinamidine synthase subunit PurL [Marivivens geojensis]NBX09043.1 phosphoribosylformylglycinamidine synthase subunit PurL [Marivivens sp.]NCW68670.1 phosphoribosylformylglycinamidine synthase subunit PurL [Marivivens sp.]NDH02668.1 phosphoribosylformylglycinamidine synthase subunit PurL [Marivivens sp.]NVJ95428.1 phosphoribosylformylglycinamidine synthase subunit PurL [Marivivens sp.]